jgi:DnaJ-domain-containing protein 1
VAPPAVVSAAGVARPQLGEVLVFARNRLVGRAGADVTPDGLRGLLRAGVAPATEGAEPTAGDDHENPFAVLGVPDSASFDEVHAAWRRHLVAYHPDRFESAGEKIRQVALTETQRLNAAFQSLARGRTRHARS